MRFAVPALIIVLILVSGGCGASREADSNWFDQAADTTSHEEKTEFVTRTDTVTTEGSKHQPEQSVVTSTARVRYTVQIGSFREPLFASAVQSIARSRYTLPVVNDYNAARKLFQIRIGFFETVEDAIQFRSRLQGEYPKEYGDAWIVQISK